MSEIVIVPDVQTPAVIVADDKNPAVINVDTAATHVHEGTGGGIGDVVFKAGEAITVGKLVYVHTDGKVYRFDSSNPALYGVKVGFAVSTVTVVDANLKVRFVGVVTCSDWALDTGRMYFASTLGAIALTNSRLVLPVGVATGAKALMIHFGTSYVKRA